MTASRTLPSLLCISLSRLERTYADQGAGRGGMPSLDGWANLLRVLDLAGVDRRELPRLARLSKRAVRGRMSAAARGGWAETLHTGAELLTDKQKARLDKLFAVDEHTEVQVTWAVYQAMVAAYRQPNRHEGRKQMRRLIDSLASGVPAALVELRRLGRTLNQRAADVLAYFDRPHTSNGPTEAINGRLEHLRGSALGCRNLPNYIARYLLEAGGFRPQVHSRL